FFSEIRNFGLVNKICFPISFQGSPLGLMRLVRGFSKMAKESDELARKRFSRRIFGILWFGNKVGEGQFRGKALPTYVYPDCLKAAIRERLSGDLRDYPNPETSAVYKVTMSDLREAKWPGDK
ncbi:unnamed protein product, partial [Porites lobata]